MRARRRLRSKKRSTKKTRAVRSRKPPIETPIIRPRFVFFDDEGGSRERDGIELEDICVPSKIVLCDVLVAIVVSIVPVFEDTVSAPDVDAVEPVLFPLEADVRQKVVELG